MQQTVMKQKRFTKHKLILDEEHFKPMFNFIFLDVALLGIRAEGFDAMPGTFKFEQLTRNRHRKHCQP